MGRIEFATADADLYCTTDDVARHFEKFDSFTSSTTPTDVEVKEYILEWMEYIDRQTEHAWRLNTVVEEEKDFDGPYRWWSGRPLNLSKRDVADLDSGSGDVLEEWDGSSWNDWLTDSSKTQGRGEDYWMSNQEGILYIKRRFVFARHPQFRVTFRYGNPNGATKAIQKATAHLVAADLITSDQYSFKTPGTEGNMSASEAADRWEQKAEATIKEFRGPSYVEPW